VTAPPRRYAYKPAALRGSTQYALDAGRLQADDGWEIALGTVEAAAFVNHVMKGMRIIRLDLWQAGRRRSLSYSGGARNWRADPDAATFLRLARDVLQELGDHAPGLAVTLGERGRSRRIMFAIGVLAALSGLVLFVAALASGISSDRLIAAALPMLLLTAMGGMIGYGYAPWRRPAWATPGALAGVIDAILAEMPGAAQSPVRRA
jgi:hypothetical protein